MKTIKQTLLGILTTATMLTASTAFAATATLTIGTVSVAAGSAASVSLTLANNGTAVIALLTTDITYNAGLLTPTGVTTSVSGKIAQGNIVAAGDYRFTVYGGVSTIADGTVATVTFNTTSGQGGTYPLAYASGSPSASDASASSVAISGVAGAITTVAASSAADIYLVGVGVGPGYGTSMWQTDIDVFNGSATSASFNIAFLERGQDNSSPAIRSFQLGPKQSTRYSEILSTFFGCSNCWGTLRVTPVSGEILTGLRAYNNQPGGTFGGSANGLPLGSATTYGQSVLLLQLSQSTDDSTGFRSHIGVVSATSAPITVNIELYQGNGTLMGTLVENLSSYESVQINKAFEQVTGNNVPVGYAIVSSATPGAIFFAFAMVVDNATSDPMYVLGQPLS